MPTFSGGGGGPASGTYLPVGSGSGVTLDSTTYTDSVRGGGAKLHTLVFATEGALLAFAQAGDAFPRAILTSDPTDGWYLGDGTVDPYVTGGAELFVDVTSGRFSPTLRSTNGGLLGAGLGQNTDNNANAAKASPSLRIGGGGVHIHSGSGSPVGAEPGEVGDLYIRADPASDATYFYRCTAAGNPATWAAVTGA